MDGSQIKAEIDKIVIGTTPGNAVARAIKLQRLAEYIVAAFDQKVFTDARNIAEEFRAEMAALRSENDRIKEFIYTYNQVLDRKKEIEEEHLKLVPVLTEIEMLKQQMVDLEKDTEQLIRDRDELIEEHNRTITKMEEIRIDLDKIAIEHNGVMNTFQSHHFENESIYGALKAREGICQHVEILSAEISDRLLKYDTNIRVIVEKRDQLPIYQLEETKKRQ